MPRPADHAQLILPFTHSGDSLKQHLERALGKAVSLTMTENSTSMLSFRKKGDLLHVRLHRMFLNAGPEVIAEIASFLRHKRGPTPLFRQYLRDNRERIESTPTRKVVLKTAGRWHDLRELFDAVNQEYLSGSITAGITWGTRCPRAAVRKRTLGSFSERLNVIRINPVLDRKAVPRYYIAFVVYHEMLHAAMGIERKGGRRSVHSREFRRREKLYREYERASAWEKGNG